MLSMSEESDAGLENRMSRESVRFAPPQASPSQPFRPTGGRDTWSSPTVKSALHNGIQDQTTLQQAMLRERMFSMSKWSAPIGGDGFEEVIPMPAGQRSGVRPGPTTAGDTIWGTISHAPIESSNAHVGTGVRKEVLGEYQSSVMSSGEDEPTYALGMTSSVNFASPIKSSSKNTGGALKGFEFVPPFEPQAYAKHLGTEPKSLINPGPMYIASDRAPEVMAERRRRRHMHGLLVKERHKPFNRRVLPGSLSEYGQHRVTLNKLIGQTHPPGDLADIGPPRVKLLACPDDNDHITYVKADHRYGQRSAPEDVGPCDVDFSQTRARTTGYSPGHLRTIRARGGVSAGGFTRSSVEAQTLSRSPPSSSNKQSTTHSRSTTTHDNASRAHSQPSGEASVRSSTARRIDYCNAMHESVARKQERSMSRRAAQAEHHTSESLSRDMEADIDGFERNLDDIKAKGWKGV
mmetsp:Transcript_2324/g.4972  ORF Transcript_2324/g.4972 Transcript_2324/m.4972 type:complete len:463 (+) Transcript_2324:80-1468(+)